MTNNKFDLAKEFKLIPGVAIFIALVLFSCMQYLWHVFIPMNGHNPPPFWFRLFFGFFTGALLGMLVLLIGYVNRDSKRRGMNSVMWTLLVTFIPNALGFVLYFFVRHPLASPCPKCNAPVEAGFNYCPKCQFALVPICPGCNRALKPEYTNCPYCGRGLRTGA